jgi:hypothetical protein
MALDVFMPMKFETVVDIQKCVMYLGRNFVAFVWKIFEVSFEWI